SEKQQQFGRCEDGPNGFFYQQLESLENSGVDRFRMLVQVSKCALIGLLPEGNIRNFCLRRKRLMKITEQLQERNYRVGICKNFDEVPDTIIDAIENCGLK
ncbi:hypothetical protein PV326_009000, partial [Microctonus aethiopoides]